MKKQINHILFFLFAATLVTAAALLTFNGFQSELTAQTHVQKNNLSLDDQPLKSALDTARFFEKPCFEYCKLESSKEDNSQVDVLSKTIVKVENEKGDFEDIEKTSVKKFPANKSLNLMVEKYTLKRKMINSAPSFFVTVESFNTRISQSDFNGFNFPKANPYETSLGQDQFDLMKSYCDQFGASSIRTQVSRPL